MANGLATNKSCLTGWSLLHGDLDAAPSTILDRPAGAASHDQWPYFMRRQEQREGALDPAPGQIAVNCDDDLCFVGLPDDAPAIERAGTIPIIFERRPVEGALP